METILLIILIALMFIAIVLILFMRPHSGSKKEVKVWMLESEKRQQEALFQLSRQMNEQIYQSQREMMTQLKQDLQTLNDTTDVRLYTIEKNVNGHLEKGYTTTHQAFGKVMEQMGKLDESQKNLKELSLSITSIQQVLTDKKTRGIFGEIELYSLLETAFGYNEKRYAKQYRLSSGVIADAVIFSKEPLSKICIDSKFPLENYNRIMEADTTVEKQRYQKLFSSDVKKHIQTIADKYIIPQETAEFAYMFLPAEAVFSYIYGSCDDIIQMSYEKKVYLVSPTTLMAYITAIKAIYLGIERNENMVNIQEELKKLQIEFERFEKRYTATQHDFERCYQDMRNLSITANKLIQRFQDIQDVKLHT